jgi:hypothetical protein
MDMFKSKRNDTGTKKETVESKTTPVGQADADIFRRAAQYNVEKYQGAINQAEGTTKHDTQSIRKYAASEAGRKELEEQGEALLPDKAVARTKRREEIETARAEAMRYFPMG